MTHQTTNTNYTSQPNPINNFHLDTKEDEIDLFELWQTIWNQKILIAGITVLVSLGAALYAISLPKTYETNAVIMPPSPSQIEAISLASLKDFDIEQPQISTVYENYLEQLNQTESLLSVLQNPAVKDYFQQKELSDTKRFEVLSESLNVSLPTESKEKLVFKTLETSLKFEAHDPQITLDVINTLLQTTANLTQASIKQNLLTAVQERINTTQLQLNLENERVNREIIAEISRLQDQDNLSLASINQQIDLLRDKSKQERQYRIERLKIDFDIAKTLKIEVPVNPQDYNRQASSITKVDFSNKDPSRYWLGTKILALEIKSLENRLNEDAFIDELAELLKKKEALKLNVTIENLKARKDNFPFSDSLRNLKTKLDRLDQIFKQVTLAEFTAYRLVKPAYLPEEPIKPKKSLIVAVAFILGGMLGLLTALIRGAILKRRAENNIQKQPTL
ncbi:Wzz/FepE/Etk N-terminal domain-containing protein [Thiomicrorhabdus aquaedulcis]|uniref:Wzz/FepE/Etk N-terminal domain-containing protein n=1 Tax=Thiomicrorhabdus aquaedulcis TaxID=2211106 RepID=UPI000FDA3498|nr:Wzz/FepE/Etk N-terminal domain-containing protein [Thiomicrorhabdus aquaedulcis]